MSISLSAIPGFTEIADTVFAAGATAADVSLKALNAAAKFAVVRNEQFWGYYKNGETVLLPVSPADGYAYTRSELVYQWSVNYTGPATTPCNGVQAQPGRGGSTGQGTLLGLSANVDQASGAVSCGVSYYKTSQMDTSDGIVMVIVFAQRAR